MTQGEAIYLNNLFFKAQILPTPKLFYSFNAKVIFLFLTKDQIGWKNQGGNFNGACNLHSWNIEQPCCYTSDHKNSKCMWEAFERIGKSNI